MPDLTGSTPPLAEADRDDLQGFLADVAAPGGAGVVIVTSRSPESWLGDGVGRLPLGGLGTLDRAAYTDQLLDATPDIGARRADRAFGQLLEWLDGHPLSMRLVLPHLATTEPAVLLGALQGTHPLPTGIDEQQGRTTSLAASLAYSFDHLPASDREHLVVLSLLQGVADVDVLGILSALDTTPARFRGMDARAWQGVLDRAAGLGLLNPIGGGMYALHPALPAYLSALWRSSQPQEDSDDEVQSAKSALVDAHAGLGLWLEQQISTQEASFAMAVIDRQRRNLGHFLGDALATERWDEAYQIANPLNTYWLARGLTEEAQAWSERVRLATETPAGDPPPLASPAGDLWLFVVGNLANRDLLAGDLSRGERTYLEMLEAFRAQPAGRSRQQGLATTLHNLGYVAQARGQMDEAEDWYRQSLTIEEELGNRSGVTSSHFQLGRVAQERGRLDEAEDWYHRALTVREELGDRPGQAKLHYQLSIIADLRQRLDEAEDWCRRGLTIREELGDRPGQARGYHQLGAIAQGRGRLDEAEDWYRRSFTIMEELDDRIGLAAGYGQMGFLAEARQEMLDALRWTARCAALLNELSHPATGSVTDQLARLTGQLGWAVLEQQWQDVTGQPLPPAVRQRIRAALDAMAAG
jgi:tetratricopeptide (TPR) repeat protein